VVLPDPLPYITAGTMPNTVSGHGGAVTLHMRQLATRHCCPGWDKPVP